MELTLRPAGADDMQAVYALFSDAVADMNARGIPQWDEIYPTPAALDRDLENGELYVAEAAGEVLGAVALNRQCDPAYDAAAWAHEGPYVIVHRLCVSPAAQGRGVGRAMMAAVETWARQQGYRDIRLDAFSQNPQALRLYEGLGYVKRGEATWRKGLFYLLEKPMA